MDQLRAKYKTLRANLAVIEKEYKSKCEGQATLECIELKEQIDKLRQKLIAKDQQLMDLVDRIPRDQLNTSIRVNPHLPGSIRDEPAVGARCLPFKPLISLIIPLFFVNSIRLKWSSFGQRIKNKYKS